MVLQGVNCFMQIVDMEIEKSFLQRHSGMLLAGIQCFKSRFRLKCRNDDWKVNGTEVIVFSQQNILLVSYPHDASTRLYSTSLRQVDIP